MDNPAALIRGRFPLDKGWLTLLEVSPWADAGTTRRFDAVSIGLWQGMGFAIHGFEVKTARSDWLRELRAPEKSTALMRYCTHWWLVAPKDVAKSDEVPSTWGHLQVQSAGLRQVKAAPHLDNAVAPPEFWRCMLLRAVQRAPMPHEIREARDQAKREALVEFERTNRIDASSIRLELDGLRRSVQRFEELTGVKIDRYEARSDAETFRIVQRMQIPEVRRRLERANGVVAEALRALNIAQDQIAQASKEMPTGDDHDSRR